MLRGYVASAFTTVGKRYALCLVLMTSGTVTRVVLSHGTRSRRTDLEELAMMMALDYLIDTDVDANIYMQHMTRRIDPIAYGAHGCGGIQLARHLASAHRMRRRQCLEPYRELTVHR